jgi:polyvinyl alcohol dehydrogenase (cytochrome)
VIALAIKSGRVLWTKQMTSNDVFTASCLSQGSNCPETHGPDFDFGASVLLVNVDGRDVLIAGQKSGMVYALDPDHRGTLLWQARVGRGGTNGGIQWGMTSDRRNVYASVSDVVKKASASRGGPIGGAEFEPDQGGGLTALNLNDGSKAWFAPGHPCVPARPGCSPAQPAALSSIAGIVFSGSVDGHLRAFSTTDGQVLWDFDSVRDYSTVDGVAARGGSMDGAGPVIVDGVLYVSSGYPRFGGVSGNVLLALSPNGE